MGFSVCLMGSGRTVTFWAQGKDHCPVCGQLADVMENVSWVCLVPQRDAGCMCWGLFQVSYLQRVMPLPDLKGWTATVELNRMMVRWSLRRRCVVTSPRAIFWRQDLGIIHCSVWSEFLPPVSFLVSLLPSIIWLIKSQHFFPTTYTSVGRWKGISGDKLEGVKYIGCDLQKKKPLILHFFWEKSIEIAH